MAKKNEKQTQTLQISDVPTELMEKIEAKASECRPAAKRNDFILYCLEEIAAGRMDFINVKACAA